MVLGSDYDGSIAAALDTSELVALTQALLDTGLSEEVIAKIMGENSLAFLRQWLPAEP